MKLLGAALTLCAACSPIRYSSQEVVLRYRAESDALDVLMLYEGIQAEPQGDKNDGVEVGSRFAGRVALGRREFMVWAWPFHLDLEEIVEDLERIEPGSVDPWSAHQIEGLEFLKGVQVVASGLYAEKEDRISLYQRFRVERWSHLVEWVDRSLRMWIVENDSKLVLEKFTLLSPETRAAWVELAKTKTRWLTTADGGLEVKLPMSPAEAGRIFSRSLEVGAKDADVDDLVKFLAGLTTNLESIEISSGHVRLAWKPENGMIGFRFAGPEDYDGGLASQMRSSKEFPAELMAREDVIRTFRGD